jgi:uncharacterized membrane protein HdeD (DUF308 family)
MAAQPPESKQVNQARLISLMGWLVLVLAAGAAILPFVGPARGAVTIGTMLTIAGLAEIVAGVRRYETRKLAMLAGAITMVAGLLFATDQSTHFLSALVIISGWLFLRSLVLGVACYLEHGAVRRWTGIAAATDFVLALITVMGLSISSLVVTLFGATPPLIASFAWLLGISFIATAMLLFAVASCADDEKV